MKVFMDEVQQQLMLPTIRSATGIQTVKKCSLVRTYGDLRHDKLPMLFPYFEYDFLLWISCNRSFSPDLFAVAE